MMSARAAGLNPDTIPPPLPNPAVRWAARILTAIPALLMALSAAMKFAASPQMLDELVNLFGYPEGTALPLGLVQLACVVLYVMPRTAMLGAILLTGYLGGAVATHARIGDSAFLAPIGLGIIVWAGLYLRDDRLHELLPFRASPGPR